MNDEPCMCGTRFDCEADNHIMGTTQAAGYLGITPRGIRLAVTRSGKLTPEGKPDGEWLFSRSKLDAYDNTRRKSGVAHSTEQAVPSNADG